MVHLRPYNENWSKLKTIASVHAINVQIFEDLFSNLIKFSETELDCFYPNKISTQKSCKKQGRAISAEMHHCLLYTIEL